MLGHEADHDTEGKQLSRRDFLKAAAAAGVALSVGTGVSALVAGCGEGETTVTAAPTTGSPVTGAAGTTAGDGTSSVSTSAEMGVPIKIGFVTPTTGSSAAFGVPDGYTVERVREWIGDGQVLGDGKKHPMSIETRDTQSDVTRVGQVAGELIGAGCVVLCSGSGPDTVNPAADIAESMETPFFAHDTPWQAFVFGRQGAMDKPFKWTFLAFFGVEDVAYNYVSVWKAIPTNMKVGVMWPNDADGASFSDPDTGFPPRMKEIGLDIVDPGLWQAGTEDYTKQISVFKKAGCEVLSGVWAPPDFANFWKQCWQQGWIPTIATVDKAILFPQAIEALGKPPIGVGLISGYNWSPNWPLSSSLTGETNRQWADEFEKRTGSQWTQPLGHVTAFEMAIWALKNAVDPTDKESIIEAVPKMKFQSLGGNIDFTAPVLDAPKPGVGRPHYNVYKTPFHAGQWIQGTKWPYEYVSVCNNAAPDIPIDAKQIPVYGSPRWKEGS